MSPRPASIAVFILASCAALTSLLACDKSPAETPAIHAQEATSASSVASSPVAASATQSAPIAPLSPAPLSSAISRPKADLVYAIGDLHGDIKATRRALVLAGAIDASDHWVGGKRVVVQTGDAVDRGDDDRDILDLLKKVQIEAKTAGGELITLLGNHEIMNVAHDFRYVTPGGFAEFGGEGGRAGAFSPTGDYAKLLSEHPIYIRVGDLVFVHGGILPKHIGYGLDRMNDEVHSWMLGKAPSPPEALVAEDGPVWTRAYSDPDKKPDCDNLNAALTALNAKRMIVGHTVQKGGITSACEGHVFRIDVGMSHFFGGSVQVLEIKNGGEPTIKSQ